MTHPHSRSAAVVLVGALACPTAIAQHPAPRPTSPAQTIAMAIDVRAVAGGVRVTARGYDAGFDAAGLEFFPIVRARRSKPSLRFTLESVRRSGDATFAERVVPVADGDVVRYDRGTFDENYALRDGDIEQSFTFRALPDGAGDLIVRGRVDSDFAPSPLGVTERGIEFTTEGVGGVSIGAVTGIGARGQTAAGSMRFADGVLELVLPAEFVDRAALPLVLDPVIGGILTVGGGTDQEAPDVAFDATLNMYLVVFERVIGRTHIYGQLIRPNGAQVGAPFEIRMPFVTVSHLYAPRVASSDGEWICVWNDANGRDVRCSSIHVDANDVPSVSPSLELAVTADLELWPAIGSDTDGGVLIAWHNATRNAIDIAKVNAISPNGRPILVGRRTLVSEPNLSATVGKPAIAKTNGTPRQWLVAWERTSNGRTEIRGAVVFPDLSATASIALSALHSANDNDDPAVDGDGTDWIVAYETEATAGSNDNGIGCASVSYFGQTLHVQASATLENTPNRDERDPDVAWCGGAVLVTFAEARAGTPANLDVFVRSVDPLLCTSCEGRLPIGESPSFSSTLPAVGSQRSGGATTDRAMIVWERNAYPDGQDGQIRGQRFRSDHGTVTEVESCTGTALATCARQGNAGFEHRLRGVFLGASTATLLLSLDRIDASCGNCALVPNPYTGILFAPAPIRAGEATVPMPIPPSPSLSGLRFYEQWVMVTALPSCRALGVTLSNAIQVVLD